MLELGGIIILGIIAQWLAWRTKVPAILPLILIGLLVGPISQLYLDGHKLIDPIYNAETDEGLFPTKHLFHFVSLAIGIILFEGGLTLKLKEIRGVGNAILKLITIGSAITFVGAGLAAHFVMGLSWSISFLFSALIIVTGPTVIAPILRNTPLSKNIATVLKWEGILIDPIGALTAVLVFEFIVAGEGAGFGVTALTEFVKICVVGTAIGFAGAFFLNFMLKKHWIPHYLINVFTLALVLGVFVASDELAHESGLLTVVVMGMALGNMNVPNLKEILDFKEALTILLISILFIILSAKIDITELESLLDWRAAVLFAIVVFLVRPVGVFLSTAGSELKTNEKLFISWVGPRGIVAAGIASLFGLKLTKLGVPGAELITPLVFLIVLGTVLLNATTARLVAKALGVTLGESEGILIVGANQGARLIAKYLQDHGRHVVLLDKSKPMIEMAKNDGLEAINEDIFSDSIDDRFELLDVGYLFAMTGSDEVNQYACDRLAENFGENGAFRLITHQEMKNPQLPPAKNTVFSPTTDFINFGEVARDHTKINELVIKEEHNISDILKEMDERREIIPLFIKKDDKITFIPANTREITVEPNNVLVYMGKKYEIS